MTGITSTVREIVDHRLGMVGTRRRINQLYLFYNNHVSGSVYHPHTVRLLPLDLEWLQHIKDA